MPCSLYDNNGFGCGACTHFLRSNSITLNDENETLEINVPVPTDLVPIRNGQKLCICLVQALPIGITSETLVGVTFGDDSTLYTLLNKNANMVHADQIRSRKLYHTFISTDNFVLLVSNCELCPTGYNFPTFTPTPEEPPEPEPEP